MVFEGSSIDPCPGQYATCGTSYGQDECIDPQGRQPGEQSPVAADRYPHQEQQQSHCPEDRPVQVFCPTVVAQGISRCYPYRHSSDDRQHISRCFGSMGKDSESLGKPEGENGVFPLGFAEAHPVLWKDSESRVQTRGGKRSFSPQDFAQAHPVLWKDRKKAGCKAAGGRESVWELSFPVQEDWGKLRRKRKSAGRTRFVPKSSLCIQNIYNSTIKKPKVIFSPQAELGLLSWLRRALSRGFAILRAVCCLRTDRQVGSGCPERMESSARRKNVQRSFLFV